MTPKQCGVLSVCLSDCLSFCLSVCLSVCLFFHTLKLRVRDHTGPLVFLLPATVTGHLEMCVCVYVYIYDNVLQREVDPARMVLVSLWTAAKK